LSDNTADKEWDVSRTRKLRKKQTYYDVEEHPHATTIGKLQYICASQKKEIRLLRKKFIGIQEQAKNAIEKIIDINETVNNNYESVRWRHVALTDADQL